MPARSPVLVLSNDLSPAAAKTSRHLCLALGRLGFNAIGRDTRLIRWAANEVKSESPQRREAYETAVVAKWNKFIFDYGIDAVISLDLDWLLSPQLFLADDQVKRIDSFWLNDLRPHLQRAPMFSPAPRTVLEIINAPKVTHHCPGSGQAEELRLLGARRITRSALAASAELLQATEPCTQIHRLAFLGDPELSSPPSRLALAAMDRGEHRAALRCIARQEILDGLTDEESTASWIRQCPGVVHLLAAAMEQRVVAPPIAAISLLVEMGQAYPEAFDFLYRNGFILDAARLVKLVNRYDRPALVRQLWRRDWLDVYGTPERWIPYGISAQPTVPFRHLSSIYRRYPAHLNIADCAHEVSANEELFEIAACGRLSLNLDSPEIRACYSDGEIILADSDEALEAAAENVLRDPGAALDSGEKARLRTAAHHLWDHRLEKALA